MPMNNRKLIVTLVLTTASTAALAQSGFLSDYSRLQPVPGQAGNDLMYSAPDGVARLASATDVMVDQVEIHFSPDSEYRGMKPEDVEALAQTLREAVRERMTAGGYGIVEQPGPYVVFLRMALTDLYLKKKERRVMQYTPWGAAAKAGVDAMRETLEKLDIIEMTLEAELADSQSGDVLGAIVIARGAREAEGQEEQRMDLDEFRVTLTYYADRLRCRLDNSKLPEAQRIDCTDAAARAAQQNP
jgi:hypothetical protein